MNFAHPPAPDAVQILIRDLRLQPHPEGGWFRETYRSAQTLPVPQGGGVEPRSAGTAIYFLLQAGNFSAFHRIRSDEIWHFYAGDALEVWEIAADGSARCTRLGRRTHRGEVFQHVVPAHTWFAARVADGGTHALVGCTVAPGFDFADFELADRATLQAQFAQHGGLIEALTR